MALYTSNADSNQNASNVKPRCGKTLGLNLAAFRSDPFYASDQEGNRLTKFRKTTTSAYDDYAFYTYDHRNRLISVEFYSGNLKSTTLLQQVDYVYDYLDRRKMRVNPLDTTTNYAQDRFAYDGRDIILEQHANNTGGFSYTTYANLWVPDGENSLGRSFAE